MAGFEPNCDKTTAPKPLFLNWKKYFCSFEAKL